MHYQIKKIYHYFHLETQSDRKTLVKKKKSYLLLLKLEMMMCQNSFNMRPDKTSLNIKGIKTNSGNKVNFLLS